MSEDTRSIGSTEAVSGKHGRRYWGFTLAFSRSFSGSFSGSLSLAFSGAFGCVCERMCELGGYEVL
jgi:hypothetical protein